MAQQAVSAVLERGGSILIDEARYLLGVADKLKSAKQQLQSMQAFLKELDDRMLKGGPMARTMVCHVREVAYEVEDIIDSANILTSQSDHKISMRGAISKYACFPIHLIRLHKLGARIDSATARMKTIFEDFEKHQIAATQLQENHGPAAPRMKPSNKGDQLTLTLMSRLILWSDLISRSNRSRMT